ncbi:ATP-binding cassette domain-containing protein, partial [Azospirillum brasilense]|nr:ATP-binding cassette domain-containing protein [Azospirillum brasilense]
MNAFTHPASLDTDGVGTASVSERPLLDVSGVTLQYKTRRHLVTATYRVDFQVFQAERYVLLGPSGCGKSSLLKAVGGFLARGGGSFRLTGRGVGGPGPARRL